MSALLHASERVALLWLQWMWPMVWQLALMGVAVWGIALVARRASPRFRYVLWTLVLVKLCLPPTLSLITGLGQWVLPERAVAPPVTVVERPATEMAALGPVFGLPEGASITAPSSPLSTSPAAVPSPSVSRAIRSGGAVSWALVALGAWLGGIAVMVVLFALEHRCAARLLSGGQPVEDERIIGLLEEARAALGVRAKVQLISAAQLYSPILMGLIRPRIAIPSQAPGSLPLEQVRPILLHELAHYRRRDLWIGLAQMVLQTLYWFHPVVWVANAQLRRERELIVDDVVLAHLKGGRRVYSDSLLSILRQGTQRQFLAPGYVGIVETPGSLTRRLKRILDANRKLSLRLGWAGVVLLVALGGVLIPQARSQTGMGTGGELASGAATQIRGRVLDQQGLPVEGARLILYHRKSSWAMGGGVAQETSATKDGSFGFKEPLKFDEIVANASAQDSYVLLAVHPDHAFAWANIHQGELQESYTLKLSAARTKVRRVTDLDGKGLPGAHVWVVSAGDPKAADAQFRSVLALPTEIAALTAVADEEGLATFTNLPDTNCYFIASQPGYAQNYWQEEDDIRLSRGAQVHGHVVTQGDKPVAGAVVWLYPDFNYHFFLWAKTDANGAFEFKDVPPEGWGGKKDIGGRYRVTLASDAYTMAEQKIDLAAGQTVNDLRLNAVAGTKVTVLALDPATNRPIAGARIQGESVGGRLNGYTNSEGLVQWTLPPGQASFYLLSPPDGAYLTGDPQSQQVIVGNKAQNVILFAPGVIGKLVALRGRLELPDGMAAAGVRIVHTAKERFSTAGYVGGSGTTAITDEAGAFELKGVPAGMAVLLYAETPDHQYVLAHEMTVPEEPRDLAKALVMQLGQTAEVELRDEKGQPRANMRLTLSPSKWDQNLHLRVQRAARSDEEGKLRIDGIVPGMEYFIVDADANLAESGWWDKFFHTTIQLIPAAGPGAKAAPAVILAPTADAKLSIKVVDTRGTVVPVKGIYGLTMVEKNERQSYPSDLTILGRLEDGTVLVALKNVSMAKGGTILEIQVLTEKGDYMGASCTYPAEGALSLRFATSTAMPLTEFAAENVAPESAGVEVLDPNGQPVPDAKVTFKRSSAYQPDISEVTDPRGIVTFKDVGQLRRGYIEVNAAGFAPHWIPRLIAGKVLIARLDNATRLAGKLLQPDGKPAGECDARAVCKRYIDRDGAEVGFASAPILFRCDGQGQYDLRLMPGIYDVEVLSKAGFCGKWNDVRVARDKVTALPEKLEPAARLEVHLVDSLTHKAVPGVKLFISDFSQRGGMAPREGSSRTSDVNGTAVWEALVPGAVDIDLDRKQYARLWSDQSLYKMEGWEAVNAAAGRPQLGSGVNSLRFNVTREMAPVTVTIERAVTVTGRVLSPDGKPVAKAGVGICLIGSKSPSTGNPGYARGTDASGAYTLNLPAGNGERYAVIGHDMQNRWADGASKPFESAPGDNFTFDLTLSEGGQVTGRVVDEKGNGVPKVWVEAVPTDAVSIIFFRPTAATDEKGGFTLKGMRADRYVIHPVKEQYPGSAKAGTECDVKVQEKATVSVGDLTWTAERVAKP